jgi:hypothetical protein
MLCSLCSCLESWENIINSIKVDTALSLGNKQLTLTLIFSMWKLWKTCLYIKENYCYVCVNIILLENIKIQCNYHLSILLSNLNEKRLNTY